MELNSLEVHVRRIFGLALFFSLFATSAFAGGTYQCDYTGSPDGVRFGWKWHCKKSGNSEAEVEGSCFYELVRLYKVVSLVGCRQLQADGDPRPPLPSTSTNGIQTSYMEMSAAPATTFRGLCRCFGKSGEFRSSETFTGTELQVRKLCDDEMSYLGNFSCRITNWEYVD